MIAQKGGLRASDLEDVIAGLKKKLKSAQIKSAETAADKWIDAYTQKKSAENSASGK